MDYCPYCHAKLLPGAKFCIKCGRPVPVKQTSQPTQTPQSPKQPPAQPQAQPPAPPVPPQASDKTRIMNPLPAGQPQQTASTLPKQPQRGNGGSVPVVPPAGPRTNGNKSVKPKKHSRHTGRTIAWVIIAIIVVIALVVGGYFVYNRYFKGKKTTPRKSQNSAIISSNVIVYSAGESLTDDQQNTTSVKKGRKSTHRSHNLPVILSLTNTTAHVRSAKKPKAGQIMSAAGSKIAPTGVLRRITSVTPSSKGHNEYDLRTKPAALTDAVTKANQTSKVVLPVTSDQIAQVPATGLFDDLNLQSMPHVVGFKNFNDLLDPMLSLRSGQDGFPAPNDYSKASANMTNNLVFSAGQKQKYGFAATGSHQLSIILRIVKKKVSLTLEDHVKAKILDRYEAGMQTYAYGLVYFFNKPLTVMVGRMPLTLTPSLVMTTLQSSGRDLGGGAKLITNIDHTIGAKYQTGKRIQPIDDDASSLGPNIYDYDMHSEGAGEPPLPDISYKRMSALDFAAFLSCFELNGFTVETGILDWQDTHGNIQTIPTGENTSGAFTLPGISGKLRGSITPHSQIFSSIAAGTNTELSELDGTQSIRMNNLKRQTSILQKSTLSNGKVQDLPWLTSVYRGSSGRFSTTGLAISGNGSFNVFEDGVRQENPDENTLNYVAEATGRFIIPANASQDKPFEMHLAEFSYKHQPDGELYYTPWLGKKVKSTYAEGFYVIPDNAGPTAQPEAIHDFMYYPKGTPIDQIPDDVKDSYSYRGYEYDKDGKLLTPIVAAMRNGKAVFDFVDYWASQKYIPEDDSESDIQ